MLFRNYVDQSAYGVCSYLGRRMRIAPARIRLYFIYISFATLGSSLIVYLFAAFWLNVKRYIYRKKNLIWD